MAYEEWPDETRQKVVEMYLDGKKLSVICGETGVPRPSVYWILHQAGVQPNRQSRTRELAERVAAPATELLDRLMEAQIQVGQLQAENKQLQDELRRLKRASTT
jgi:transposase-like protein